MKRLLLRVRGADPNCFESAISEIDSLTVIAQHCDLSLNVFDV